MIDPEPEAAVSTGTLKPADMEAYTALLEIGNGGYVKFGPWADECKRRGIVKADSSHDAQEKALKRIELATRPGRARKAQRGASRDVPRHPGQRMKGQPRGQVKGHFRDKGCEGTRGQRGLS